MRVTRFTVSDDRRQKVSVIAGEALELAAHGDFKRIAFAGRTLLGRSGIAIDLITGHVTGHKIDPLPYGIRDLVWNAPSVRTGLERALSGEDVIIGSDDNALAIKWCGHRIEVFGAGEDSL